MLELLAYFPYVRLSLTLLALGYELFERSEEATRALASVVEGTRAGHFLNEHLDPLARGRRHVSVVLMCTISGGLLTMDNGRFGLSKLLRWSEMQAGQLVDGQHDVASARIQSGSQIFFLHVRKLEPEQSNPRRSVRWF
jgi:hypothetical protein